MTVSEAPLRRFALTVYRCDGVSEACLHLQDRFGTNVNLVLFAAYLGVGGPVQPSAIDAARARVDAWHREVVVPLRRVRRRLKSGPPPAPDDRTAALREKLKALEVEAELIELDELGTAVPVPFGTGDVVKNSREAIELVIRSAGDVHMTDDDGRAVDAIATAAAQIGARR